MTTITDTLTREKIIVRTSIIGIATNLLLASFKAAVGVLAHSIAVILDAVNNLSDVLSSLITLIGVKLANKAPDKKHPLGHGRIEYISAMLVSAIVSYAGIAALVESVKKIFHPQIPIYSESFFIVVVAAIVVKLVLGRYVKRQGQKVSSGALVASGADAFFDAILSVSVLGCAIIYVLFQFSLEAYVGVGISLVIIKAGLSMLQETLHDILGQRADTKTTQLVKQIIGTEPEVRGVYDLMINNYGPNKNYASVHLELPDTMCVDEVDQLTRRIEEKVYHQTGIILTGVGVYSYNTKQGKAAQLQNDIQGRVLAHDWALQLHGFYANIEEKTLRFDVVLSFDISPQKAVEILQSEIKTAYPDYAIQIVPDVDICD
ncbi:cation diffusion facilitator family transporter [Candidatus Avelusimicrobium luingense]|uniref:cation diffusion facilitator family transporter n=1 Tax=Candidatus Avelusimicrobium luingense TaxID=3416211 RepID=UPI003D10EFB6